MTEANPRFWESIPLREMSLEQFEAICDGCGRCCMHKLQDQDSGDVVYTDVACRLLDVETCRCTDYDHRTERVSGCVSMSPGNLDALSFLPNTCAYRRLDEGRGLADWHPLVCGHRKSIEANGISMIGQAISESYIHPDEISIRQRPDIRCDVATK